MKKIWGWAGKFISGIAKIFTTILVISLLVPIVYFAWRAGQPMEMPQFDGRTYYELLAERKTAYAVLAEKYQTSHQNKEVKFGMCYGSEVTMAIYNFAWGGFCALADAIPTLATLVGPSAHTLGCGATHGNWFTLLPTWWNMYERFTYDLQSHAVMGPVAYCRIQSP